jgi:hypothetical protein
VSITKIKLPLIQNDYGEKPKETATKATGKKATRTKIDLTPKPVEEAQPSPEGEESEN